MTVSLSAALSTLKKLVTQARLLQSLAGQPQKAQEK